MDTVHMVHGSKNNRANIPLWTPLIDPNWINSKLVIALVNNFLYPDSKFSTTHLHHHYCHNPLCDRLGNVLTEMYIAL